MTPLVIGLFAIGYPAAVVVLARFRVVVRARRAGLFLLHEAAMAAVVIGWALLGEPLGVVLNGAWLAAAAVWWLRPR